MSEISPCPKCGGMRVDTYGKDVGLEIEYSEKSDAIVCLSCRYVELYVKPEALEKIKLQGSVTAWENSPEARAIRAELKEQLKQIQEDLDRDRDRKRRFLGPLSRFFW